MIAKCVIGIEQANQGCPIEKLKQIGGLDLLAI
jgi:hypothetical protein